MAKKRRAQMRKGDNMDAQHIPPDEQTPAIDPQEEAVEPAQADEAPAEPQEDPASKALEEALKKQDEYLEMAQRARADFENYRRRNQNVRREAFDDGARSFAAALLPVLDNLERALSAAQDSPDESLKNGIEMVLRLMCDAFDKRGIKPIDRLGERFDPNLENAVLQGEPDDGQPGTVCAVLQKGYQLDGVVIRHAMVKVVPEA